ncbi:MAG: rhodanese-like domain-containing protein [Planctomycetota bacterium]
MASIGVTAEELGRMLYDSLHEKLMKLPDETLVYPAHGAGSMCGKNLSKDTVSTIGEQKKVNYALQPMSKDEFIRLVAAEQPRAPRYFAYDAKLNRSERGVLDDVLEELVAIPIDRALELASEKKAQIVDTRDAEDWAAGHLRGAFHIGLEGKYATWAGTILDASRPIIVLTDEGKEREAAMRLGRIGFDRILGWIDGGIGAVARRQDLFAVVERVNPGDLAKRLAPEAVVIVDVRTEKEFEGGHAVGAVNLPLDRLAEGLEDLPRDRTLALQCRTGYRSAVAASLLERAGFARLLDQRGGFVAWSEAGCPVEAVVGGGGCTR